MRKLFAGMDGDTIESQSDELQSYAEAAPDEFLSIIEKDLAKKNPNTQILMRPVDDPIFSGNPRVELIWALEILAWSPELLLRVVDILAKLCVLEPEDRSGNTAMQSLLSIFRSWMPQTAASIEQRIAIFDQLVKNHPEVGWAVARDQYDAMSRTGDFNVKPKWRDYAFGSGGVVTNAERWKFDQHCLETALSWTPKNGDKLADLIDNLENFDDNSRTRIWEQITDWAEEASDEERARMREQIRISVSKSARRLFKKGVPKASTKKHVNHARDVYDELEPNDIIWKYAWLFKNGWIENSWDEIHEDDHDLDAHEKRITKQRKAAVKEVFAERRCVRSCTPCDVRQCGTLCRGIFSQRSSPPIKNSLTSSSLSLGNQNSYLCRNRSLCSAAFFTRSEKTGRWSSSKC